MEPVTPTLPDDDVAAIDRLGAIYKELSSELSKMIIGQQRVVELLSIALFSRGHALLMGVPGLAKTLLVSSVAKTLDLSFNRIQFTPDLMPADITGTDIIQDDSAGGKRQFEFIKGPVFANIVLADEINRAPAKTQSALLEAMQERRVTVMGRTFTLLPPFFVLATQNPIEQEGTYPLPEAQLDRFLFKVLVKFPDRQELREIVELTEGNHPPKIEKVMDKESLLAARACVAQIPIADAVMDYILDLVMATHADNPYIREGASPRAAQALIRTARARAFMENRLNVSFEDVKCVALPVLRHRILLSFDAVSEGITEDAVIGQILTEKEQGLYA